MNNRISSVVNKLFNIESDGYVFIYTPPKVGSTTLVSSLRLSLGNSYSIVHIHDEVMLNVLTGVANVSVNEIINYLHTTYTDDCLDNIFWLNPKRIIGLKHDYNVAQECVETDLKKVFFQGDSEQ